MPAAMPTEMKSLGAQAAAAPAAAAAAPPHEVKVIRSSFLSDLVFLWILPSIAKANRRGSLSPADAPGLPPGKLTSRPRSKTGTRPQYEDIDELWLQHSKEGGSLIGFTVAYCRRDVLVSFLWSLLTASMLTLLRPLLLKWFVDAFDDRNDELAYRFLVCFVLATVVEGIGIAATRHNFADRGGCAFVSVCAHLMQAKALRLAPGSHGDASPDTLLGSDVSRTFDNMRFFGTLMLSILSLVTGLVAVIVTAGGSGVIGIIFLVCGILGSTLVATHTKVREQRSIMFSDRRLAVMKRILEGVKAIKFSVWEDDFARVVKQARRSEVLERQRFLNLQGVTVNLGRAAPLLATVITFVVRGAMGGDVKASSAFATLSVFEGLRIAMINGPLGITYYSAFRISLERIEKYLLLPEFRPHERLPETSPVAVDVADSTFRWSRARTTELVGRKHSKGTGADSDLTGGALLESKAPDTTTMTLESIQLTCPRGTVTGIVGAIGSGKTSVVCSLVGELELVGQGRVAVDASVGYVPQKAFIVAGTVLHNIVMGREFDEFMYEYAVTQSQLATDIASFPQGRLQEIGERGITLSGGQMQRISIARALYGRPRLLILDDPLSAVDAIVGHNIFIALEEVAHGGYPGSDDAPKPAVVIAANQLQLAPRFDHCVMMVDCKIAEQGRHSQMMESGGPYSRFFRAALGDDAGAEADGEGAGAVQLSRARTDADAAEPLQPADEQVQAAREPGPALLRADVRATGGLSSGVLAHYMRGGGYGVLTATVVFLLLGYLSMGFAALVLADWADATRDAEAVNGTIDSDLNLRYMMLYGGSGIFHVTVLFIGGVVLHPVFHARSVRSMHDECADRVLHAPLSWFESTPSGRLLGRFSSDLGLVDVQLGLGFEVSVAMMFMLMTLAAVVTYISPPMAPVFAVAYAAFFGVITLFANTNREFKRMATMANAPVLTLMGETLSNRGQTVIRCMGFEQFYRKQFAQHLDKYLAYQFASGVLTNWQVVMGHSIGSIVALSAALLLINAGDHLSAAQAGLALAFSFNVPLNFQTASVFASLFRISLGGLERVLQLLGPDVEQEPDWHTPADAALPASWPSQGAVKFDGAKLVYREGLPPAIKGVTVEFDAGTRVGIVGRTGAGKSSMLQLLFRLRELTDGKITVDGVDISRLGLRTLRSKMVCLPQEPLLIEGTLKDNLDPFGQHSDEQLRTCLRHVGLEEKSSWTLLRLRPVRIRGAVIGDAGAGAVGDLRAFDSDGEAVRLARQPAGDGQLGGGVWRLESRALVAAYAVQTVQKGNPSNDPAAWVLEAADAEQGPWTTLHRAGGISLPTERGAWGDKAVCDGDLRREAESLSAGERQLVALARALLRDARVVVMDEPTSNVDAVTDGTVQHVIRTHLKQRTIVTIAHRLNTVIDAHRLVVMDSGNIAECGRPADLLDREGQLAAMAQQLGPSAEAALRSKAAAARAAQESG
eukprot:TRINITY_DN879_c0_g1_i1.p1 TRINITY_DN879_c0_g1~~TRINITY_DN879_c0_g1_i1.p1  ORF type:complete len:1483 (+),score=468.48 TRINITY_DN879_c0_g1_i1:48-4451(+)